MLARSSADCWLKLPEISALPPVSAWLTYGSETTSPSRTMANWFCGDWFCASLPVMSANFLLPLSVKSMVTVQPAPLWRVEDGLGLVDVRAVDLGRAEDVLLPLALGVLAAGHGRVGGLDAVTGLGADVALVQSSAAYCAWSLRSPRRRGCSRVADAEGWPRPNRWGARTGWGRPSGRR